MKSIFLLAMKLRVYLTELPVVILLYITIKHNDSATTAFKFYPLIVFLCLVIMLIAVYFFRGVSISYDEIRQIGLFSGRDKASIEKDRTLVISLLQKGYVRLELYGEAGEPIYDWQRKEDTQERDLCYFRCRATGGEATAKRVLKFFGIEKDEVDTLLSDGATLDSEKVLVNTEIKNEIMQVKVRFKETII